MKFRVPYQEAMAAYKDQAMNRRTYDTCKSTDDLRLTTGPGRYQLGAPQQYCDACYAPEPTIRQQKWGATLNSSYTKTDVESDLFNINRPNSKAICNQYNPATNKMNATAGSSTTKDCEFPQTHSRLVDPPCTLRSSGFNRWEWLCQNPQEGVMIPFDNLVTTRLAFKDSYRPCIPKPINSDNVLPAPSANDPSLYGNLDSRALARAVSAFPRGMDVLPE
jgi:hypothetical protein